MQRMTFPFLIAVLTLCMNAPVEATSVFSRKVETLPEALKLLTKVETIWSGSEKSGIHAKHLWFGARELLHIDHPLHQSYIINGKLEVGFWNRLVKPKFNYILEPHELALSFTHKGLETGSTMVLKSKLPKTQTALAPPKGFSILEFTPLFRDERITNLRYIALTERPIMAVPMEVAVSFKLYLANKATNPMTSVAKPLATVVAQIAGRLGRR